MPLRSFIDLFRTYDCGAWCALIIGIESETDHLPVGEVRKLWASSALKEKDVEIARAEELYRADFLETCRRIVQPHCPVDE